MFGSNQTTGFNFGAPAANPTTASTGFSFPSSSVTSQPGSLFGSQPAAPAPTTTSSFGGFGGFGSSGTTANQPSGAFGTTTGFGSSFGAPTQQQQPSLTGFSGFGTAAPAFGAQAQPALTLTLNTTTTTAPTASFASTGFSFPSSSNSVTGQPGSLFGSQPPAANPILPTTTTSSLNFGGFGSSGPTTSQPSGALGTTSFGSSFGASTQQPSLTSGFSFPASSSVASQPGNLFGSQTAANPTQPTSTTSTTSSFGGFGGFGSTGATANQPTLALNTATTAPTAPATTKTVTFAGLGGATLPTNNGNSASKSTPLVQFQLGATTTSTAAAVSTTSATQPLSSTATTSIPRTTLPTSNEKSTDATEKNKSAPLMPQLQLGATTASTAAVSTTQSLSSSATTSIPQITFGKLEDQINLWTNELSQFESDFHSQGQTINSWDSLLIANGQKLIEMKQSIEKLKCAHRGLDHQLDFIIAQQKELEQLLDQIEQNKFEMSTNIVSAEREHTYSLVETVNNDLNAIGTDLKDFIKKLNEAKSSQDSNDPIVQISKILSSHMDVLQWIENQIKNIKVNC